MPDLKISQLPVATTPLAGTELVPIVQGGTTDQTTVEAIMTSTVPSGTADGVLYLNSSKVATSGSALTFTSGGNLLVGSIINNASGGVIQVSNGVTFPATQSASSDANTLDDYEEGNWTPTQGAGITLVGSFSSLGKYTKIGNLVYAYGYVAGSTSVALSTAGTIICAGLPFAAPGVEGQMGTMGNNATSASGAVQVSSSTIYNNDTMAATTKIFFSVTYYV